MTTQDFKEAGIRCLARHRRPRRRKIRLSVRRFLKLSLSFPIWDLGLARPFSYRLLFLLADLHCSRNVRGELRFCRLRILILVRCRKRIINNGQARSQLAAASRFGRKLASLALSSSQAFKTPPCCLMCAPRGPLAPTEARPEDRNRDLRSLLDLIRYMQYTLIKVPIDTST